jgi:hypothetical protein
MAQTKKQIIHMNNPLQNYINEMVNQQLDPIPTIDPKALITDSEFYQWLIGQNKDDVTNFVPTFILYANGRKWTKGKQSYHKIIFNAYWHNVLKAM